MTMQRLCLVILVLLGSASCRTNVRSYKQSNIVSQNFYAIKDSSENGRYDLAHEYIDLVSRLIIPPTEFISIEPVVGIDGKLTVVLPEKFKNQTVVTTNSEEYKKIVQLQNIAKQLAAENKALIDSTKKINEELISQENIKESALQERDNLKAEKEELTTKLSERSKQLLTRNITIGVILLLIGLYVYIKGTFKLPI